MLYTTGIDFYNYIGRFIINKYTDNTSKLIRMEYENIGESKKD
jgi:hypothetical protein